VKGTFRTKENEAVEQMLNKGSTGKQESLQIKTYVGKLKENPSENRMDESITISN
jgi:ribosomal protein L13